MIPSPADPVDPLRPAVQRVLDRFLARQRGLLRQLSTDLIPLADAAADLLSGGKRLRPAFCYWGWRAVHGDTEGGLDALITASSALELFQAAALVHDDLIDGSDTRRGKPSVHRRFAARHGAEGWHGTSAEFGAAAAILLGDLLLGWSDELLAQSGLDSEALRRARPVFDLMRTEVGAGQYLDILAQADTAVPPAAQVDRARQVIQQKSARYSVQHPLVLGGRIADAPDDLIDRYQTYGTALGEAFQLRDDILGVFGDPEQTGKPAGDDLREGKRTLLVAHALERADPAQTALVDRLLGRPDLDDAGVDRLRKVLVETSARDRVEARITELVADAECTVEEMKITDDGRAALSALIALAATRTR